MPNFNDIGMLLHIKEKLLGHPKLAAITAHVDAALEAHAKGAVDEPLPEIPLTKAEQEAKEAAEKAAAEAEEQRLAAEKEERTKLDNQAERTRFEQEQRRATNQDDALKATGQPRVPEPNTQQDLSRMNNPPASRVEGRFQPPADEPTRRI